MPGWRNSHESNSAAAEYSLENIVIPSVANAHPDWSRDQIRFEGLRLWGARRAQDGIYDAKESANQDGVTEWKIIERNGIKELATQYGEDLTTLEDLWAGTEQYAATLGLSHLVDQQEKNAQIEMQRKIIAGEATSFVSALSHPDSVKYIQVLEKIDDNTVVSKQIDLFSVLGRTLSHSEGAKLIQHLADFMKQTGGALVEKVKSLYPHFMLQIGKIQADVIRTIARSMEVTKQSVQKFTEKVNVVFKKLFVKEKPLGIMRKKIDDHEESQVQPIQIKQREVRNVERKKRRVNRIVELIKKPFVRIETTKKLILPKLVDRVKKSYERFTKVIRTRVREITRKGELMVKRQASFELFKKKIIQRKDVVVKKIKTIRENISIVLKRQIKKIEIKSLMHRLVRIFVQERKIGKIHAFVEKVKRISFAFTLWFTRRDRYHALEHDNKKTKDKMGKQIEKIAPTPWLLLAIIWHLTMKRESGQMSTKKPKAKFPQRGLIFAYAT